MVFIGSDTLLTIFISVILTLVLYYSFFEKDEKKNTTDNLKDELEDLYDERELIATEIKKIKDKIKQKKEMEKI